MGVLHKVSADSSFVEVLPYEQLDPGLLAASPLCNLQLKYLKTKSKGKLKPFYSIIVVTQKKWSITS